MSVGLYGCGTCLLTLREERRLKVSESRVLRGSKGIRKQRSGENYITRTLMICRLHQLLLGAIKSRRMRWAGHVALWGRQEVHTGFWWGDLTEGDYLEYLGSDGKMILKWVLRSGMDWIDLAQKRDRWRAVVNAIMNLRVPFLD